MGTTENKAIVFGEKSGYEIRIEWTKRETDQKTTLLDQKVTLLDKNGRNLGRFRKEGEFDYSPDQRDDLDTISQEFDRITHGEKIIFLPAFNGRKDRPELPPLAVTSGRLAFYVPLLLFEQNGNGNGYKRIIRPDETLIIPIFPQVASKRIDKAVVFPAFSIS